MCVDVFVFVSTYLYIKKPLGLHLIDGFYHVLGQAIAGAILCALNA